MEEGAFAYFRLPGATQYTLIKSSSALELNSLAEMAPGFVIAPFERSERTPLVLIRAEEMKMGAVPGGPSCDCDCDAATATVDDRYRLCFEKFHYEVCAGRFGKLVLSRRKEVGIAADLTPEQMFLNACRTYPRLMVMLFHTPLTGTWITATPEPLLEYADGRFHTVALAGTMKGDEGEWSEKNRKEQQCVADFILSALSHHTDRIDSEGPYTAKAGELFHLRTDFSFDAPSHCLGAILSELHPTPAVCGLPQDKAKAFIREHEGFERRYYSGFAGPVGIDGKTGLFVSLRCAEIDTAGGKATLYAGGGIMSESDCQSEFEETERKMRTIERCIATR